MFRESIYVSKKHTALCQSRFLAQQVSSVVSVFFCVSSTLSLLGYLQTNRQMYTIKPPHLRDVCTSIPPLIESQSERRGFFSNLFPRFHCKSESAHIFRSFADHRSNTGLLNTHRQGQRCYANHQVKYHRKRTIFFFRNFCDIIVNLRASLIFSIQLIKHSRTNTFPLFWIIFEARFPFHFHFVMNLSETNMRCIYTYSIFMETRTNPHRRNMGSILSPNTSTTSSYSHSYWPHVLILEHSSLLCLLYHRGWIRFLSTN
ncbi:hypothetical protein C8Q75DRAFT_777766 [Abortiporus biennis]|nr:hypothetical protein C8Q75DRAFT_777766 [Abortiporus biennis]